MSAELRCPVASSSETSADVPSEVKSSILGHILGLADSAYAVATNLKAFPAFQFFSDGWGDMAVAEGFETDFNTWVSSYQQSRHIPSIQLHSAATIGSSGISSRIGSFQGGLSSFLRDNNTICEFELVQPRLSRNPWACVILLPGTGDQSYTFRKYCMALPLAEAGIVSIIPTAPFYGCRKPAAQWLHYIRNVSDFCMQSGVLLVETMQLLDWAADKYRGAALGVAGLSWGGAMAAALGLYAKKHALAVVPGLPSASAKVIVTGAIRKEIAINRLAAEKGSDEAGARAELLEFLDRTKLESTLARVAELPGHTNRRVVRQWSAWHDSFVSCHDAIEAFGVLRSFDSRATLQWVVGGHASAFATAKWSFAPIINSALKELASGTTSPPLSRL